MILVHFCVILLACLAMAMMLANKVGVLLEKENGWEILPRQIGLGGGVRAENILAGSRARSARRNGVIVMGKEEKEIE